MKIEIPIKLVEAIQKDNLILFVGAGCSIPIGMPTWKDLIIDILLDLDEKHGNNSNINFNNISKNVKSNAITLFDALNKIEGENTQYKKESKQYVYSKIEGIDISNVKSSFHSLLWEVSKKIITTNYDKVLENFKPNNHEIKVFNNENQFQTLKSQQDESQFLYKIHGDYENPDSIILFESDYNNIYNSQNHNYDALSSFIKGKTILFIGFSLSDPFVTTLFKNIKEIYGGYKLNDHFIFSIKEEDFSCYDVNNIKIDNWNDYIIEYLSELKKCKENVKTTIINNVENLSISNDKEEIEDYNSLNELIKKKIDSLKKNPSDNKLNIEINDLRSKLDKHYFSDIDYLQQIPEYRNNELRTLFETIYSTEKFDRNITDRINRIRIDYENYNWYDRSVLLSAIACSIIHFNKADENKISLIVDFINDNEEKVWQKSITYLFMVLNHLGNKWLKSQQIKNKLALLKANPSVQNACFNIIQLFNIGYHNVSFLNEKIFINDYFRDNPFNYFLPFFSDETNEGYNSLFENYVGNIDDILLFLNNAEIPDQIKYLICNSSNEELSVEKKVSKKDQKKIEVFLENIMHVSSFYYPYSIYVHELINFYKFFPDLQHVEKLKYQLKITETPIKEYLLNEVEKCKALASHFMKEKMWGQAIININSAIKMNLNDVELHINLADCYFYKEDYDKEFEVRMKIKSLDNENVENKKGLFSLYERKEDFEECLKLSNELLLIDDQEGYYYGLKAKAFEELGMYEDSIQNYFKAIEFDGNNSTYYHWCANVYLFLNDFNNSLKYIQSAETLNHDKVAIYNFYANYYRLIGDFDKALEYIDKAIKLDKDFALIGTKAVIYSSKGDEEEFYKMFEIVISNGISPKRLYPDIKNKYKDNQRFINLLSKYNLTL